MIRILQIGMTDNLGGIETYLMNYYRNIDKNKYQFDFINISNTKLCFENEIRSLGGRIYNVTSYYKHPLRYIKELKKIIKENDYHIVHCNMNSAVFLYPLIASKQAGVKQIISHSHNSSSDKGLLKKILHDINKHFIPKYANTYFACSDKAGEWFYNKKTRNSNDYYIINNAIDSNKFKYNEEIRNYLRKELNIENKFVIGHVGRFSKQKNHKFLVELFNKFQEKNKDAILMLVGIGELQDDVRKQVNDLNLQDKVLFLNQKNNVNELYQAMDVFILPSLYEGLPVVGVEAQTSGLPCIFSNNITKGINLLSSNKYIDLNRDINYWVNEINNIESQDRNIAYGIIRDKRFDIIESCNDLCNIYRKAE